MSAELQREQHPNTYKYFTSYPEHMSTELFTDYANFLKGFMRSIPTGVTTIHKYKDRIEIDYLTDDSEDYYIFRMNIDGTEEVKHVVD